MKSPGWYGDSWRHSLAAKGVKSNYFARRQRSPDSVFMDLKNKKENEVKKAALKNFREDFLKSQTDQQKLLRNVRGGDLSDLSKALKSTQTEKKYGPISFISSDVDKSMELSQLSGAERSALTAEANRQAVDFAISGAEVPAELQSLISKSTKNRIQAIRKEQKIESRGALNTQARAIGKRGLEFGEEGVRAFGAKGSEAIGAVAGAAGVLSVDALTDQSGSITEGIARNDSKFKNATNTLQERSSIFETTDRSEGRFPSTGISASSNVFLGDNEGGIGKDSDNGAFDFLSDATDQTSPLSSAIVPREKFRGVDFGMDDSQQTYAESISNQVESLWSAKSELGRVDKSPLKKGEKAFKLGDREKLIEAINDQEFQIKQQESRWNLVNQTKRQVESSENHRSLFEKKSGAFSSSMFGGSAGRKIADETKKINEVTKVVKQGSDEARARSQVLRGNLQRLDATVPFDDTVPSDDVKLFKKEFSVADLMKDKRGPVDERV